MLLDIKNPQLLQNCYSKDYLNLLCPKWYKRDTHFSLITSLTYIYYQQSLGNNTYCDCTLSQSAAKTIHWVQLEIYSICLLFSLFFSIFLLPATNYMSIWGCRLSICSIYLFWFCQGQHQFHLVKTIRGYWRISCPRNTNGRRQITFKLSAVINSLQMLTWKNVHFCYLVPCCTNSLMLLSNSLQFPSHIQKCFMVALTDILYEKVRSCWHPALSLSGIPCLS